MNLVLVHLCPLGMRLEVFDCRDALLSANWVGPALRIVLN